MINGLVHRPIGGRAPTAATAACRTGAPARTSASTRSASTARTTTTRCGGAASSSASRPRRTRRAWAGAAGARSRATCTTTSAPSARAWRRSASRSSSAASRGASRASASACWRAASAGPARSTPTCSRTGRSATRDAIQHLDPARIDTRAAAAPLRRVRRRALPRRPRRACASRSPGSSPSRRTLDEWAACAIEKAEDVARALRAALLLRLRGRRPRPSPGPSTRASTRSACKPARDVQLRHRPLGRARHGRDRRGGLRAASRSGLLTRRGLPRLRVRQSGALLHQRQSATSSAARASSRRPRGCVRGARA